MSPHSVQSVFLDEVKKRLPPHVSFADELAEILSISRDSAYRRIRGETVLSLDEVSTICKKYNLPLDNIIWPSSEVVSFHNRFVTEHDFTFERWLKSIENNLDSINASPKHEMIISAKDVPIFYYFDTPHISAFKMFFWMKSVLGYQQYQKEHFRAELVPQSLIALGKRIYDKFNAVHRTELWSDDTIHASLRQIEYYHDCGFLNTPGEAQHLCDELLEVIRRIRELASNGANQNGDERFHLFKNEILIADNTFLFKMGERRQIFINHNTLNVLTTTQQSFCIQTENYLLNLLNRATKISATGEKQRFKFFNTIEEKINALRKRVTEPAASVY